MTDPLLLLRECLNVPQITCSFCEKWTAQSWHLHRIRLDNMKTNPDVTPHPCPQCGGTYWASKPPPFPEEDENIVAFLPTILNLIIALLVGFIVVFVAVLVSNAEEALPFARGKNSNCPSGYYASGDYCTPTNRDSRPAVPRPQGASCPSGFYASGNACVRLRRGE
jgi:hypothetical protein